MADRFISVMGGHIFHCWADGIKAKDVIGYGTSGYVALLPNSNEVIKVPHPGDADAYIRCAREIEVYKRFETTGGRRPQSIVGYKGLRDDGSLRLEYAAGGNFKQHLSNLSDKIRIHGARMLCFQFTGSVLHWVLHVIAHLYGIEYFLIMTLVIERWKRRGSYKD